MLLAALRMVLELGLLQTDLMTDSTLGFFFKYFDIIVDGVQVI